MAAGYSNIELQLSVLNKTNVAFFFPYPKMQLKDDLQQILNLYRYSGFAGFVWSTRPYPPTSPERRAC